MKESVIGQLLFFGKSIVFGGVILFLYDGLRLTRYMWKHEMWMLAIEDIIFWFLASVAGFRFLYQYNYGEPRSYLFLGLGIGMIVYYKKMSPRWMRLMRRRVQWSKKKGRHIQVIFFKPYLKIRRNLRNQLKDEGKTIKIALKRASKRGEGKKHESKREKD